MQPARSASGQDKANPVPADEIRPLDVTSTEEIALVAERMRRTLLEVVGDDQGYSLEWLVDRVRWHLDATRCRGQVLLATDALGRICGHTMVRVEEERVGLFSTTYLEPAARRRGLAMRLLQVGEEWMRSQGMQEARTYTHPDNHKLIQLYTGRGYALEPVNQSFVKLSKDLTL